MLIVIVGPTGSGKTSLALTLSKKYSAPIINGDAFQIYKEMAIGTAKVERDSEDYKNQEHQEHHAEDHRQVAEESGCFTHTPSPPQSAARRCFPFLRRMDGSPLRLPRP